MLKPWVASLITRCWGMMVLNTELKSRISILTYVFFLSRCYKLITSGLQRRSNPLWSDLVGRQTDTGWMWEGSGGNVVLYGPLKALHYDRCPCSWYQHTPSSNSPFHIKHWPADVSQQLQNFFNVSMFLDVFKHRGLVQYGFSWFQLVSVLSGSTPTLELWTRIHVFPESRGWKERWSRGAPQHCQGQPKEGHQDCVQEEDWGLFPEDFILTYSECVV